MQKISQRPGQRNSNRHWLVLESLDNAQARRIGHIVTRFTQPHFEAFDRDGFSRGAFETRAEAALALQGGA